jgi:hypothetical protein
MSRCPAGHVYMPKRGDVDENVGLFGECFVGGYCRLNGCINLRDVAFNLA